MIEFGEGNLRIPKLTRPVYVVGAGMTDFRKFYPEKQSVELCLEATKMAVEDNLGMTSKEWKGFVNFCVYWRSSQGTRAKRNFHVFQQE